MWTPPRPRRRGPATRTPWLRRRTPPARSGARVSDRSGSLAQKAFDQALEDLHLRHAGIAVLRSCLRPGQPLARADLRVGREPGVVVEHGRAEVDEPVEPMRSG